MKQTDRAVAYIAIAVACGMLLSCATGPKLTEAGKSVQVKQYGSPTCDDLGPVGWEFTTGNYTVQQAVDLLRNMAANKGATHLVLGGPVDPRRAIGGAARCPETFGLGEAPLRKRCDAGEAMACVELGGLKKREGAPFAERIKLYDRACKMGEKKGCSSKNRTLVAEKIEKLSDRCKAKDDSKACLQLSNELGEKGDLQGAVNAAQRACSLGNNSGCQMHATLVNHQNNQQRMAVDRDHERQRAADAMMLNMMNQPVIQVPQIPTQQPAASEQSSMPGMSANLNCGMKPAFAKPGCRIGQCVNGHWQTICD